MPKTLSQASRLKHRVGRVLLGATAAVALVILVVNPELAALSFLFDPVLLDVAILFFGTQILLFDGQIRSFFSTARANIAHYFKAIRSRR
ncbi:MAG: hypothetical protein ACTS5I_01985 [Rhodanobacter sp.]